MSSTVSELRRAWAALESGQFADVYGLEGRGRGATWTPAEGERLLPVVGAHGTAGASTLALAIATMAAPARVVECAPTTRSGLVGAATAELGRRDGWLRGTRDQVVLERWDDEDPVKSPTPLASDLSMTVVDVGSHVPDRSDQPWLAETLDGVGPVIVVGDLTLPGIRRIQQALSTPWRRSWVVALRGPKPQRSPRYLRRALEDIDSSLPLVHVPDDPRLRLRGVDIDPLPPPLLAAAQQILTVVEPAWRKEPS